MRDIVPQIHEAGAELAIMGNGTPEQANWFVENYDMKTPVYTDPALAVYDAIGAQRGVHVLLHPRACLNLFRALRNGYRQTQILGSAMQLGAVIIVMPDGSIPYRYLSRALGDQPKPQALIEALVAATQAFR